MLSAATDSQPGVFDWAQLFQVLALGAVWLVRNRLLAALVPNASSGPVLVLASATEEPWIVGGM